MEYFQAKSDLKFIRDFRDDVLELGRLEDSVRHELAGYGGFGLSIPSKYQKEIQRVADKKIEGYQGVRERVSKGVVRAVRIAHRLRIPVDVNSVPAPMVGGVIIPQNILMAIIKDSSHGGIERQLILDTMNMIEGACETRVETEWKRLLNPLNWIKYGLGFILRIPFMLIEATGFDVGKVEDHLFAKLFKVAEVVLLIYILLRLGLGRDGLIAILKGALAK
jgi:hypothetical protein